MSKQQEIEKLAQEVLDGAREQMLVEMRFLAMALNALPPAAVSDEDWPVTPEGESMAPADWVIDTDGRHLLYHPGRLLRLFRDEPSAVVRKYMHTLLHCLYRHMFNCVLDDDVWELACDIAVHAQIRDIGIPSLASSLDEQRSRVLDRLEREGLKRPTAEFIHRHLREHATDPEIISIWKMLFQDDSHLAWYQPPKLPADGAGGESGAGDGDQEGDGMSSSEAAEFWQDISERMQLEMETMGQQIGNVPGSMLQSIRDLNRERCDYGEFLRRFAAPCEVMKLSEDEFDYIYYSYGLSHYGNIPLIEPLEYREDKRIHDFVIAIDTSGSTFHKLVRRFLQKTYNIIKQQTYFRGKFNLHIIQCDARVQQDTVITCDEDLERYIRDLKVKGGGGTDFRPVFRYVEQLREEGRFRDLRGLIYFTDGMGTYPEARTPYQTAFVFMEGDTYDDRRVPPWAIKLIINDEQLS